MEGDSDDDSDDWATDELPELPPPKSTVDELIAADTIVGASQQQFAAAAGNADDEEGWESKLQPLPTKEGWEVTIRDGVDEGAGGGGGGEPMILFDMTQFTRTNNNNSTSSDWSEIHSRFDAHSVNDPQLVRKLRKHIESEYEQYSKNPDLLASATVIPCGSSVWKMALSKLRQERPGHYFCPIFPS